MKSRREVVSSVVVLSLLMVTAPALADESAPDSEFTYTDDWAVVSAPPPPGPYRAVNIDPRVPGVDAIPPLSMDKATMPVRQDIPAEALANAPSAGIPATRLPSGNPASTLDTYPPAQVASPAQTRNVPPVPSRYYYPAPSRYPAQTRSVPQPGYRVYGSQPNYGYGSPAYRQGQQQVPPPPVYDSTIRNQSPYGYPTGKGTP
jgi:hypothetical protein